MKNRHPLMTPELWLNEAKNAWLIFDLSQIYIPISNPAVKNHSLILKTKALILEDRAIESAL